MKKGYKKAYEISPLIEAACCISNNGKGYDINMFDSWVKDYVIDRLGLGIKVLEESSKVDRYIMDGKKEEIWTIAYYPIHENGKTGKVYGEPRALIERKILNGIDFREMPLRYLEKINDVLNGK